MTTRQQQIFERYTGHSSFETYLQDYRDKGIGEIEILDSMNELWESGFATFCMENFEYEAIREGIRVQVP
jgi:hypothetical protein